jgi:hypothetical protein
MIGPVVSTTNPFDDASDHKPTKIKIIVSEHDQDSQFKIETIKSHILNIILYVPYSLIALNEGKHYFSL